jgi:hypothetical protein
LNTILFFTPLIKRTKIINKIKSNIMLFQSPELKFPLTLTSLSSASLFLILAIKDMAKQVLIVDLLISFTAFYLPSTTHVVFYYIIYFENLFLDIKKPLSFAHNRATCFERCKQLLQHQNLLLLSAIWWPKLLYILNCCLFFQQLCF